MEVTFRFGVHDNGLFTGITAESCNSNELSGCVCGNCPEPPVMRFAVSGILNNICSKHLDMIIELLKKAKAALE